MSPDKKKSTKSPQNPSFTSTSIWWIMVFGPPMFKRYYIKKEKNTGSLNNSRLACRRVLTVDWVPMCRYYTTFDLACVEMQNIEINPTVIPCTCTFC